MMHNKSYDTGTDAFVKRTGAIAMPTQANFDAAKLYTAIMEEASVLP